MPSYSMVTFGFMKQIFKGEKSLLKAADVKICNPPHYPEISVSTLYDECLKLPGMKEHFPDSYPKNRKCGREYFFTILMSTNPLYCQKLIAQSKKLRFAGEDEDAIKETIEVEPKWEEELKEFP